MRLERSIINIGFCLLLFLIGCSRPAAISYQRTGEVRFVSTEDKGTITVDSKGFASDISTATYYAERNAFENLLFKGIPGSNQVQPIIPDENIAWQQHGAVLKKLLSEDYSKFVMSAETRYRSESEPVEIDRTISVDINSLRKYLESEGVIRKFGF